MKIYRHKRDTAICTKVFPPVFRLFVCDFEERNLQKFDLGYTFLCDSIERKHNAFFEIHNEFHLIIKFTARYSKKSVHFLD